MKKLIAISCIFFVGVAFQNCGEAESLNNTAIEQPLNQVTSASVGNNGSADHINTSSYKGHIYFDGKVLTGIVCSKSAMNINIIKGGTERVAKPALSYTGDTFRKNSRFYYKYCNNGAYSKINYFSYRLPATLRSGASFKINDSYSFSPIIINPNQQKFGIQYTTYHCPMSSDYESAYNDDRIYDIQYIRQNGNRAQDYGPINWHHWLERPVDGYYCLSNNSSLILKHAVLLKNAGVDYIYIDMTNDPKAYSSGNTMTWDFRHKIHKPVMKLIDTYKKAEAEGIAVPKIVAWLGSSTYYKTEAVPYSRSISRWVNEVFYPKTAGFRFRGFESKPILFVKVGNPTHFSWDKVQPMVQRNESRYKVIIKWAKVEHFKRAKPQNWTGIDPANVWRFFEECKYDANGSIKSGCQQRSISSQISVAAAFQRPFMSHHNSLGKRRGRTFYQQYLGAFNRDKKYVSFSNWNNWLSNRYCFGSSKYGGAGIFVPSLRYPENFDGYHCNRQNTKDFYTRSNGSKHAYFVDSYNYEFSRVLEPSANSAHSDCSYQLMRSLVMASKAGQNGLTYVQKMSLKNQCGFDLRQ